MKELLGYLALLVGGAGALVLVCSWGEASLSATLEVATPRDSGFKAAPFSVVPYVIGTLAAVVALGTLLGRLAKWVGQPPVVGEVIAGIVLGPSLLGLLAPEAMAWLIPPPNVDAHGQVSGAIKAIAQLGIVLYMFVIGLQLHSSHMKHKTHATIAVSHASIVVPMVLGAMLAVPLYSRYSYATVPFSSFALFLGVAMSITAFPVLARILSDRGLDRTPLGAVALACAAADDATAWCLLALVTGVARADFSQALFVFLGTLAFLALFFLIVRPLVHRAIARWESTGQEVPTVVIPLAFVGVLLAAYCTEKIGIHALFGAFLLGAIMPSDSRIARYLVSRLLDPVVLLLLPAFFAYTGMRTQLNLVVGWENLGWCAAILLVATLGKLGGTYVAARWTGMEQRDSLALGALMNTRGLMELIVLNIGLDLGVLSPTLYAMMVVMAIVTTLMTTPFLVWLGAWPEASPDSAPGARPEMSKEAATLPT